MGAVRLEERQIARGTSAISACGTADKREIPEDQGTSAAVRKSDVSGTWLVGDTCLGFLLDVREGAGRSEVRRLVARRLVPRVWLWPVVLRAWGRMLLVMSHRRRSGFRFQHIGRHPQLWGPSARARVYTVQMRYQTWHKSQ